MISACKDTLSIWSALTAGQLHSRTLALDRFLHFPDDANGKEWRRKTCEAIRSGKANTCKLEHWRAFLEKLVDDGGQILFGQLKARLIANGAGGVLENGGMSLDRNSGLPFIPGSAIKGCARRWAIWELNQASSSEKARILEHIALIFGWVDQDWSDNKNSKEQLLSDFKLACRDEEAWEQARQEVAEALAQRLRLKLHSDVPKWKQLPPFAGSVCFLPAFPWDKDPGVDMDLVACHHQKYYNDEPGYKTAPDIEEPVPVVFPVISAEKQPLFAFCLLASRRNDASFADQARTWLRDGLEQFGIGAKTNAGYGWFDCGEGVQTAMRAVLSRSKENQEKGEPETKAKREASEAVARAEQAEKERLANALPFERFKAEYAKLADEPFATLAKKFSELNDDQRQGFIHALKERRRTAKRWAEKKPELLKPWQEHARKLEPPIQLP
jgi:CRISPR-associated protein Cmr6